MIKQELYWQEAQRRGFDVGEVKARDFAIEENRIFEEYMNDEYYHRMLSPIMEIYLAVLDMTEDEYLEWSISLHRKELSREELFNSMNEEEYLKLGEELLLKADIEYHKQFKMLER